MTAATALVTRPDGLGNRYDLSLSWSLDQMLGYDLSLSWSLDQMV